MENRRGSEVRELDVKEEALEFMWSVRTEKELRL